MEPDGGDPGLGLADGGVATGESCETDGRAIGPNSEAVGDIVAAGGDILRSELWTSLSAPFSGCPSLAIMAYNCMMLLTK